MDLITLAVALAIGATVYSFISGISTMAVDGEVRHHSGTGWMARRVAFQAIAVLLVLIAVLS